MYLLRRETPYHHRYIYKPCCAWPRPQEAGGRVSSKLRRDLNEYVDFKKKFTHDKIFPAEKVFNFA